MKPWLISLVLITSHCVAAQQMALPFSAIQGFEVKEFATVPNARQMALTPAGHIVVGTRRDGRVYGLKKTARNSTGATQFQRLLIASKLNMPAGVAVNATGDLFIAATHQILRINNIDDAFAQNQFKTQVVTNTLPKYDHHGWKHIGFSPKGDLIIPIGVPCNICLSEDPIIGSIQRFNLKTNALSPMAVGVRNSVGFDFHPTTKRLWFSDNGRDWMGDELPPDEINEVTQPEQHFGFPFVHGRNVQEPDKKIQKARPKFLNSMAPKVEIQAHSAPLGIHFYTGKQFPARYRHALFVALHGSWNRSEPVGYKVVVYWFDENDELTQSETIIEGFLLKSKKHAAKKIGRPVDFLQLPDGSLLVSDDLGGKIWQLSYKP